MLDLHTVHNNTHKFLKFDYMQSKFEEYKRDFKDQDMDCSAIFNQVQALVFACLTTKEPVQNYDTLVKFINKYNGSGEHNKRFKELVDITFDHIYKQYKDCEFSLKNGEVVNFGEYIKETHKELNNGKILYNDRARILSENKAL